MMNQSDQQSLVDTAKKLFEQIPVQQLLNSGTLPTAWVQAYEQFLAEVEQAYQREEALPRDIVAVIYEVSVYLTKRYSDWQRVTKSSNDATQAVVDRLRWAGDRLVMLRDTVNNDHDKA